MNMRGKGFRASALTLALLVIIELILIAVALTAGRYLVSFLEN